jgi:hypothetical protein
VFRMVTTEIVIIGSYLEGCVREREDRRVRADTDGGGQRTVSRRGRGLGAGYRWHYEEMKIKRPQRCGTYSNIPFVLRIKICKVVNHVSVPMRARVNPRSQLNRYAAQETTFFSAPTFRFHAPHTWSVMSSSSRFQHTSN